MELLQCKAMTNKLEMCDKSTYISKWAKINRNPHEIIKKLEPPLKQNFAMHECRKCDMSNRSSLQKP